MAKFITIGERIHCISPVHPRGDGGPETLSRFCSARRSSSTPGATYLDVNIGPAENDGEELMQWAVKLLQDEL